MYINPFVAGILATVYVELLILFLIGVIKVSGRVKR